MSEAWLSLSWRLPYLPGYSAGRLDSATAFAELRLIVSFILFG